jgi:glutathione S-transferase
VSHYNEKARWALDYKRVPHVRRAALPGRHQGIAADLTGGTTFPVLVLDGVPIGDSTDIIDALERRFPDPPLYPDDPDRRRTALELEEFFDEELGPDTRVLCIHHLLADPDLLLGAFFSDVGGARRRALRAAFPVVRSGLTAAFSIDEGRVALAFEKVRLAGERFRSQLGPRARSSRYLVGGEFTVADLTLASVLAPVVAPEQFPYPQPQRGHPLLAPVRDALAPSGLLEWTRDVYARHRSPSAELCAAG